MKLTSEYISMSSLLESLTNKRFKECPAKFSKLLILFGVQGARTLPSMQWARGIQVLFQG